MKKVKNAIGTSDEDCQCDSWLDHWEIYSGMTATACANLFCPNDADRGGHIHRIGTAQNRNLYIVPLCASCNNDHDLEFFIDDNLTPCVSAYPSETCSKK